MTVEEVLEEIKNTPQLTLSEKRESIVKYQIGSQEEKERAFIRLQNHYLPLTLDYVRSFCKMYPEDVKDEDDVYSLINDGFIFLSEQLQEYLFPCSATRGFRCYFKTKLKSHLEHDMIKLHDEKEENIIDEFKNETVAGPDDLYPIYHAHLEKEMAKLDQVIQEVLYYRYGYSGKPCSLKETMTHLNISLNQIDYIRSVGIEHLQGKVSYEEGKTMLYRHQNQIKVIK